LSAISKDEIRQNVERVIQHPVPNETSPLLLKNMEKLLRKLTRQSFNFLNSSIPRAFSAATEANDSPSS
jgi:hypothetical protein